MHGKELLALISARARHDSRLAGLCGSAEEYLEIYALAKRRQKGCDGLGEMTNLKDELSAVFDDLLVYCKEKGYLDRTAVYDADRIIEEAEELWLTHDS